MNRLTLHRAINARCWSHMARLTKKIKDALYAIDGLTWSRIAETLPPAYRPSPNDVIPGQCVITDDSEQLKLFK